MISKITSLVAAMLFSGAAFAEGAAKPQGPAIGQFLILGVFILFMFWMMRNQSKRAKEQQNLINKLEKGDEVVVSGGLVGKISNISDNFFSVQFAEGVEILVQKSMIATTLPKGTMKSVKF
jgi:preprotein translocase subunit YajC